MQPTQTITSSTTRSEAPATTSGSTVKLICLPGILERVTISRSDWLQGVKAGIYPAPVRLSPRRVAWRESDINEFINGLAAQ
ncbi:MAG: AlpA family phage regulatory protein [Burkholderiaceae bacterium]|jgi:prophage regulatory protein|nr:AlpA family phage regulatory protein [Pseudomonadota bacterium]MBS0598197.1 AlpA family phage regulatory protein [Pseudomonadota bacterium]MCO5115369.1 AlpA family transcriptional regulator [Burkholderiaceae bacterium]MCP5218280.1 AlpA family phage regulatory protein [Burkholderiaceae bacterium]